MFLAFLLAVLCVSPDGRNAISFEGGERPHWAVTRDGRAVTGSCDFGLRFGKHTAFGGLEVVSSATRAIDSTLTTKAVHCCFSHQTEERARIDEYEA